MPFMLSKTGFTRMIGSRVSLVSSTVSRRHFVTSSAYSSKATHPLVGAGMIVLAVFPTLYIVLTLRKDVVPRTPPTFLEMQEIVSRHCKDDGLGPLSGRENRIASAAALQLAARSTEEVKMPGVGFEVHPKYFPFRAKAIGACHGRVLELCAGLFPLKHPEIYKLNRSISHLELYDLNPEVRRVLDIELNRTKVTGKTVDHPSRSKNDTGIKMSCVQDLKPFAVVAQREYTGSSGREILNTTGPLGVDTILCQFGLCSAEDPQSLVETALRLSNKRVCFLEHGLSAYWPVRVFGRITGLFPHPDSSWVYGCLHDRDPLKILLTEIKKYNEGRSNQKWRVTSLERGAFGHIVLVVLDRQTI